MTVDDNRTRLGLVDLAKQARTPGQMALGLGERLVYHQMPALVHVAQVGADGHAHVDAIAPVSGCPQGVGRGAAEKMGLHFRIALETACSKNYTAVGAHVLRDRPPAHLDTGHPATAR